HDDEPRAPGVPQSDGAVPGGAAGRRHQRELQPHGADELSAGSPERHLVWKVLRRRRVDVGLHAVGHHRPGVSGGSVEHRAAYLLWAMALSLARRAAAAGYGAGVIPAAVG